MNSNSLIESIKYNLKVLLTVHDMSLRELEKISGLSRSTIYSILEKGSQNPQINNLIKIARAFNITLDQLIGQMPLNIKEVHAPIVNESNFEDDGRFIDSSLNYYTEYVSSIPFSENRIFAFFASDYLSNKYDKKTLIIIEQNNNPKNNDMILIKQQNTPLVFKKAVMEGNELFLSSYQNTPQSKYDPDIHKIIGIVREIRKQKDF